MGLLFAVCAGLRAQTLADWSLTLSPVVSGLEQPVGIELVATNDFLVLEKNTGKVRRVTGGVLLPEPVLDLAVANASEAGLLGIARHPGFSTNRLVYLTCTASNTGFDTSADPTSLAIYRYEWSGNELTDPVLVAAFPIEPGVRSHLGGVVAFGPDGKLYLVIGDRGQLGPLQNEASGTANDTSVILRLNDDGSVPADNPLLAAGGPYARYYAYGIRNSFGLAFDPVTGHLWDTENGPNQHDEINLVLPGFNSGWNPVMGVSSPRSDAASNLVLVAGAHYADPQFVWNYTVAPTGIAFLPSAAPGAAYENDLFVADFNHGNLYHFDLVARRDALKLPGRLADRLYEGGRDGQKVVLGSGFSLGPATRTGISALKAGPDGRLYVVLFVEGQVFLIFKRTDTSTLTGVLEQFRKKVRTGRVGISWKLRARFVLVNGTAEDLPATRVRFFFSPDQLYHAPTATPLGEVVSNPIPAGHACFLKLRSKVVPPSGARFIVAVDESDTVSATVRIH